MRISTDHGPFLNLLENAQSIYLLVNPEVGMEALSAALGLRVIFLSLGKKVEVFYPATFSGLPSTLEGIDQVKRVLPPPSLMLSFNLGEEKLKKVGYFRRNGVFHLVLDPETNPLNVTNLKVFSEPPKADLLVLLGYPSLNKLESHYSAQLLSLLSLPIVNLDYHQNNERYGQANVVDENASSIAEIIFSHLGVWGLKPSYRSAECLLIGLGLKED